MFKCPPIRYVDTSAIAELMCQGSKLLDATEGMIGDARQQFSRIGFGIEAIVFRRTIRPRSRSLVPDPTRFHKQLSASSSSSRRTSCSICRHQLFRARELHGLQPGQRQLQMLESRSSTRAVGWCIGGQQVLERLAQRMPSEEIFTFAKFLLLTEVILPILPKEEIGRFPSILSKPGWWSSRIDNERAIGLPSADLGCPAVCA
jgi:hypothetical protein